MKPSYLYEVLLVLKDLWTPSGLSILSFCLFIIFYHVILFKIFFPYEMFKKKNFIINNLL